MKGIVVEIKNGTAAVLTENGEFVKVQRRCAVGDTIELSSGARRTAVKKILAACAAFVLVACGSLTVKAAVTPYSYVTVDVNPSIEYKVNFFDTVIGTEALNKEAEAVTDELEKRGVRGSSVTGAVELTMEVMADSDYLKKGTSGYVIVSVASRSKSRADTLTKSLSAGAEAKADKKVTVDVEQATIDDRETAKELGISTGRLQVAKKITGKNNREISGSRKAADEVSDAGCGPVRDMIKKDRNINGGKSGNENNGSGSGNSSGSGSGSAAGNNPGSTGAGSGSGSGSGAGTGAGSGTEKDPGSGSSSNSGKSSRRSHGGNSGHSNSGNRGNSGNTVRNGTGSAADTDADPETESGSGQDQVSVKNQ
ncbi:MAG: anti-sigma factor domain-containing protein [Eubacteriaceae bacterium]|jgi:hypothetical protein|nr:anti-sigma factor domain-containing protein [Eubacteriaceae bacterium]